MIGRKAAAVAQARPNLARFSRQQHGEVESIRFVASSHTFATMRLRTETCEKRDWTIGDSYLLTLAAENFS